MSSDTKLGFGGLTALVLGLVIGMGIYNLPQNIASATTPTGALLAWGVTAAGFIPLVIAFKWLNDHFPQYKAGLYQYSEAQFGRFAGFLLAWGYWLCTAFPNVAYGVMLNDSVGAIFPPLLGHEWETFAFCSMMIWLMYSLVIHGIRTAKAVNTALAVIKIVMLLFIITILVLFFKLELYHANLWEQAAGDGSLWQQVKDCMMVTLFCFIGIEGAAMMSARARNTRDVGRAGIAGLVLALALYVAVSLLSYGLMSRARLAGLHDPSIAYLLADSCGQWAYWCVIASVIISLLGGWVAWTLIVAQVPYEASLVGIMPRTFSKLNRHGMPSHGLLVSSIVMEAFLVIIIMADDLYLTALRITGLMVIPCYLFTGIFMAKHATGAMTRITAWLAIIFGLWMTYAGGLLDMLYTSLFYIAGIGFYIKTRREQSPGEPPFTQREKWLLAALVTASAISAIILGADIVA